MPHFHHGALSPFLSYYAPLGDSPQQIVWNALTQPSLTASLLFTRENLNALLAFLLLLDLPLFLIAAPSLLLNGLSENPLMHLMEDKHYAAPIIPFALLATIGGLARLRALASHLRLNPAHVVRVATIILIACTLLYHTFRGFTPLSRLFVVPQVDEHDHVSTLIESRIQHDASLVAQDRLYPHLSQRESLSYIVRTDDQADYIFLDVAHEQLNNTDNLHDWLKQQITQRMDYGIVASQHGYVL